MAIVISLAASKAIGSAGSATFRRLNGRTVLSEKAIHVRNPRTLGQGGVRTDLLVASTIAGVLGEYFEQRPRIARPLQEGFLSKRRSRLLPRQKYISDVLLSVKNDELIQEFVSNIAGLEPFARKFLIQQFVADFPTLGAGNEPALVGVNPTGLRKAVSGFNIVNQFLSGGGAYGSLNATVRFATKKSSGKVQVNSYAIIAQRRSTTDVTFRTLQNSDIVEWDGTPDVNLDSVVNVGGAFEERVIVVVFELIDLETNENAGTWIWNTERA